jgi:hypothetical protein
MNDEPMSYRNNPPPIIMCDQCGGTTVFDEEVFPQQQPTIKMSEYATKMAQPKMTLAVYIQNKHRLICKDCGYFVEYYQPV